MSLHGLHRAHLLAIPFENIDVQLSLTPPLELDAIFEKIVERGRGGWCFEMNGLFGWALRELGFKVDFVAAAVGRDRKGADAALNHLALIVQLDAPYLADVGFGNGSLTPLALREGLQSDGRFEFRLTREGDWWRFHNHKRYPATYDFTLEPRELSDFAIQNRLLATTAESHFVQNLICVRAKEAGFNVLTNAALSVSDDRTMHEESAPSAAELQRVLDEHFGLRVDRIEALWQRVSSQHKTWLRKKIRGF